MRRGTLVFLLTGVIFAGCADEQRADSGHVAPTDTTPETAPPSTDEAASIISDSQSFGDYQFTYAAWSFPLDRPLTNETQLAMAGDLADQGWIELRDDQVVLTEKARQDRRFLERPNGSLDIVPLARKELTEVVSVEPGPRGEVIARFRWKWIPNEVGDAFRSGPPRKRFDAEHEAVATLRSSGDSWEVWSVKDEGG